MLRWRGQHSTGVTIYKKNSRFRSSIWYLIVKVVSGDSGWHGYGKGGGLDKEWMGTWSNVVCKDGGQWVVKHHNKTAVIGHTRSTVIGHTRSAVIGHTRSTITQRSLSLSTQPQRLETAPYTLELSDSDDRTHRAPSRIRTSKNKSESPNNWA